MKISKSAQNRITRTLLQCIDKDDSTAAIAAAFLSQPSRTDSLDNDRQRDRIKKRKSRTDADIPEKDLIFRTAENGKKYAINTETGETSGLGKSIDNGSGPIPKERWAKMSDADRLGAKHPKNTSRAGHKKRSESIGRMSREDFEKSVQKDTGSTPEEAREMITGLRHYAGATYTYHDVRVAARSSSEEEYKGNKGRRKLSYADAKRYADGVEAYIDSAPVFDGGPLIRGVSDKHNPLYAKQLFDEAKSAMEKDEPIGMNGFSSWSTDTLHAGEFGADCDSLDLDDGVIPSILYKLPVTYQGVSVDHFNEYLREDEILISSKARFRPTKAYIDKSIGMRGSYVVELEEI